MSVKIVNRVKRFRVSRQLQLQLLPRERDLSLGSEGFIGKPVPLSPTLLGVFILNQYYRLLEREGRLEF